MDAPQGTPAWVTSFGWAGGLLLAICLVPETLSVYSDRKTDQLRYEWLFLYALGLASTFTYLVLIGAVAAYVPMLAELANVLLLIGMKYVFEKESRGDPLLG
mmetsp:Transcript_6424/g.16323  ORF Transcript_6424/g.16323 Transcript_6424/m.16323 type:complete len:102 (-) Transcript_6424:1744-2049(-)